jgi:hypothetical protein
VEYFRKFKELHLKKSEAQKYEQQYLSQAKDKQNKDGVTI